MHSQQTVRQKYSVMIMKNNDSDVLRILLVNTHGFSASLLDGPWKEIYFDRTTIFIIKNVYSDVRRYLQRSCLSAWKVCLWMVKSDYIHCLSSWGHFLLTPSYRESNIYILRTRVCIAVWLAVDAESLPSTNAHITHCSLSICVCPSIYPSICLYVSVHSTINLSYIYLLHSVIRCHWITELCHWSSCYSGNWKLVRNQVQTDHGDIRSPQWSDVELMSQ